MTEPDELYTLRAQYWLGHYHLAAEEAKSVARRPMSTDLKAEREEYLARALIASSQFDKVTSKETPALQALALKAQFDSLGLAAGNESAQGGIVDQLKALSSSNPNTPAVQLTVAQVLLAAGNTKEALQQIHATTTLEAMTLVLQIYLKLDRLDLARNQHAALKRLDEEAVLTQLAHVYVSLAQGRTGADDALHSINALSEQYGASPLLLNLSAAALAQRGDYAAAEAKLQECLRDYTEVSLPETHVNLIACAVHQQKPYEGHVQQLRAQFPNHAFLAGLGRVEAAFDRESIKYKV